MKIHNSSNRPTRVESKESSYSNHKDCFDKLRSKLEHVDFERLGTKSIEGLEGLEIDLFRTHGRSRGFLYGDQLKKRKKRRKKDRKSRNVVIKPTVL